MKKILMSILLTIMLIGGGAGCADKQLILIPQEAYYPTFPTQDFEVQKTPKIKIWEESDKNGIYILSDQKQMLGYIQTNKENRSTYNLLLKKLKEFNAKIKQMNKEQNDRKPKEVDSIDNRWFN